MTGDQKILLNSALELLVKLDQKSMCIYSEDLKIIAEKIHTAYNISEKSVLDSAKEVMLKLDQCSPQFFQRKLKITYNEACRVVDQLEETGCCGPFKGSAEREILITKV